MTIDDVDLSDMALAVATNLQDAAPERQAEFVIAPDLQCRGRSDALMQVALDNLLGNAWKFTAPRSPARIEFGKTVARRQRRPSSCATTASAST